MGVEIWEVGSVGGEIAGEGGGSDVWIAEKWEGGRMRS